MRSTAGEETGRGRAGRGRAQTRQIQWIQWAGLAHEHTFRPSTTRHVPLMSCASPRLIHREPRNQSADADGAEFVAVLRLSLSLSLSRFLPALVQVSHRGVRCTVARSLRSLSLRRVCSGRCAATPVAPTPVTDSTQLALALCGSAWHCGEASSTDQRQRRNGVRSEATTRMRPYLLRA